MASVSKTGVGGGETCAHFENSEVWLVTFVAVAERKVPPVFTAGKVRSKVPFPPLSVVTVVAPIYVCPSP